MTKSKIKIVFLIKFLAYFYLYKLVKINLTSWKDVYGDAAIFFKAAALSARAALHDAKLKRGGRRMKLLLRKGRMQNGSNDKKSESRKL